MSFHILIAVKVTEALIDDFIDDALVDSLIDRTQLLRFLNNEFFFALERVKINLDDVLAFLLLLW